MLIAVSNPVLADSRQLEWHDDGLYINDYGEVIFFEPLGEMPNIPYVPRIAAISPDEEWIAFIRHSGGGFENEGMSVYIATWDGNDEYLLLQTDRIVPAIYWLEADGQFYLAVQQHSGGTMFRSFFSIVDFGTCQTVTQVEGMIYVVSNGGARYYSDNWWMVPSGVRYEVLSQDEEPYKWGIFYVDELMNFESPAEIVMVDDELCESSNLTDGRLTTAWIGQSNDQPSFVLHVADSQSIRGLAIRTGWQYHQPPAPDELPWDGLDTYLIYDRPYECLITFDNGASQRVIFEDKRSIQWVYFDEGDGIGVGAITFTIESVYKGEESDYVAISEIWPI